MKNVLILPAASLARSFLRLIVQYFGNCLKYCMEFALVTLDGAYAARSMDEGLVSSDKKCVK